MRSSQTCSECGAALPLDAPPGVCPKCALSAALEVQPDRTMDETDGASAEQSAEAGAPVSDIVAHQVQRFGDYELLEEIARGGMGIVYRARQIRLDRIVAVKLLPFSSLTTEEFIKRFRAEASAAAALRHPNIVTVHEVGVYQGQHYLVMNFVNGPPLSRLVTDGPLLARRAATYLKVITEAVHYAHEKGILHRDLKPSNVLIDADDQPLVSDFGLAKRLDGESSLTLTGQALGSPGYMPPEQATAEHSKVTRRSDVYGLGAMLYHLLTGRPPFQAGTLNQAIHQVVDTEPLAPDLLNPGVPRDLQTICLKCLEKEPERRYATAQEVADELGRFLNGEPIHARPVGAAGRTWRWCRRRPMLAGLSVALVFTFLAGFAGVLWQWRRAQAGERLAQLNAYAADIKLAQQSIEKGDLGNALSLLNKHRPAPPDSLRRLRSVADLRGWEWRYLWQLCQSEEQSTLARYPSWVGGVVVATNLNLLAVQRGDGRIALWDLSGRREITNLTASGNRGTIAFSATGNLLAAANTATNGQAEVRLWDLRNLSLAEALPHDAPVLSLEFSADGRFLATRDTQDRNRVWEIASRQVRPPHQADSGGGWASQHWPSGGVLKFSPDGARLAFRDGDSRIRVLDWRAPTNSEPPISSPLEEPARNLALNQITTLSFSPDGRLLAWGYGSGTVYLWDLLVGKLAGKLEGHSSRINALAFTPDGLRLASASSDQTIRVWDPEDRSELRCLRGNENEVWAVEFLPDGVTLVSGGKDGSVRVWDITSPTTDALHRVLPILFPRFTPDGQRFIALDCHVESLRLWDARTLQPLETLTEFGTNNYAFSLSRDGKWLALVKRADPTMVRVVDWRSRTEVAKLPVPSRPFAVNFNPDSRMLSAEYYLDEAGQAKALKLWNVGSWEEEPPPPASPLKPDFWRGCISQDARLVAVGYESGEIEIRDNASDDVLLSLAGFSSRVETLDFSPDGSKLAAAGLGDFVKVWDVKSGRELMTLRSHVIHTLSVGFSPDGRRLAVGGVGGTRSEHLVQLWDLATQRELLSITGGFWNVRFSPDGDTLIVVDTKEYFTHFWRAPSWEEIEAKESASSGLR